MSTTLRALGAITLALAAGAAQAQLRFTEVAPWSSGNSPVAADWFEITNFGGSAVEITGFKVDDSSNLFTSSAALAGLTGVTLSTLSMLGVNGAFASFTGNEIGSVGVVPEPGTWAMLLAGMAVVAGVARRRA